MNLLFLHNHFTQNEHVHHPGIPGVAVTFVSWNWISEERSTLINVQDKGISAEGTSFALPSQVRNWKYPLMVIIYDYDLL